MNLAIDRGNTKIKIAVFDGKDLIYKKSFKSLSLLRLEGVLSRFPDIDNAILSFTKKFNQELIEKLNGLNKFILLDHEVPLPFTNYYHTPETLGRDRMALMAAASNFFPNRNILVIDAGTCVTVDLLNFENEYRGGSIHPGLSMRLKALHTFTGKLPLVKRQPIDQLVGRNTEESILVGTVKAMGIEMEGIIAAYSELYDNLIVVTTGGDADFFVSHIKNEIFALPNFALQGLNEILEYNL